MAVVTDYWEWKGDASGAIGAANQLGGTLDKLDRRFGKSAQALGAMGGAMGRLGNDVGRIASDMADFGGMMLGGGVIGLGLGAATLGFKVLGEMIADADKIAKSTSINLDTYLSGYVEKTKQMVANNEKLKKQIADFGLSASQVSAKDAQTQRDVLKRNEADLAKAQEQKTQGLAKEAELNKLIGERMAETRAERMASLKAGVAQEDKKLSDLQKQLTATRGLIESSSQMIAITSKEIPLIKERLAATKEEVELNKTIEKQEKDRSSKYNLVENFNEQAFKMAKEAVKNEKEGLKGIEDYEKLRAEIIKRSQNEIDEWMTEKANRQLDLQKQIEAEKLAAQQKTYQSVMEIAGPVTQSVSSSMIQLADDLVAGSDDAGKKFAQNMLRGIGTMLFGKGIADMTAAVASGLIYGDFAGVGPAGAEIAIGSAMMAGSYVAGSHIGGGGGGGGFMRGGIAGGTSRPATTGGGAITINVSGAMTGAEAGRNVGIALKQAHSMGYL